KGGVGEDANEILADLFLRVSGEDAAVDVGLSAAGERVGRVAGGHHGGDAGGAHGRVVDGAGGETLDGCGIGRGFEDGAEVCSLLRLNERGAGGEFGARDFVEFEGEGRFFEAREGVG